MQDFRIKSICTPQNKSPCVVGFGVSGFGLGVTVKRSRVLCVQLRGSFLLGVSEGIVRRQRKSPSSRTYRLALSLWFRSYNKLGRRNFERLRHTTG